MTIAESVEANFPPPVASPDGFMRPIAEWLVGGLLALAEPGGSGCFGCELHGGKPAALVAAITKRLCGRETASAIPVVFPCFQIHLDREPGGNVCAHAASITDVPRNRKKKLSVKKRPQLPHPPGKKVEGSLDRGRAAHVNPRCRKGFNRIPAASAPQECHVARRVAGFQDLICKSRRRRDAGGIFVNVEGVVKVGNARPFTVQQRVDGQRAALIFFI